MTDNRAIWFLCLLILCFAHSIVVQAQTEAWPQFARHLDYSVWYSKDRATTDSMNLIEGGEYTLGGPGNPRKVQIVSFYILRHEVCNKQYLEFMDHTDYAPPVIDPVSEGTWPVNQIFGWHGRSYPPGRAGFPVTGISFADATAFCEWRTQQTGVLHRLPSENEWEATYRGKEQRLFPWGSDWKTQRIVPLFRECGVGPDPFYATTYDKTPSEVLHLLGNVTEFATLSYPRTADVSHVICGLPYDFLGGNYRDSASWNHKVISDQNDYKKPANELRDYNLGFRYVIPLRDEKPIKWPLK